jgi:uncharacterized protein YndB with AHSA1/START domain
MIDNDRHVNSVRRELGDRPVEGGEAIVGTISQVYPTGIDDMWDAVTNPDRIVRWFAPVAGEFKEGGSYQITGNASGTVTSCDKPRGYDLTWEFAGQMSWVEVRLTPEGDGTRFQIEHIAQVPGEFWEQFGPGATGVGWDLSLLGLARHLQDPSAVPDPEEIAVWHETAEGQAFLRASADGWGAAAAAHGVEPDLAKAQAERTYKFYTGQQ